MRPQRTSLAVATALAVGCLASCLGGALAQQTNPEVQYYAVGKAPKGLSDFQALGLFRKVAGGKVHYDGWVMTDLEHPNDSAADMATLRVAGKRLTFTSKAKKGTSFSFDGVFLKSGDLKRWFNTDTPVLQGRVRKMRRGRVVAEGVMRFRCGMGG